MSYLFTDNIAKYLDSHIMDRHPVFLEMERYAAEHDFPIVGPQVGQLLFILTRTLNAQKIFEVGSGFGYSALWFALGIRDSGTVICTEHSESNIVRARQYIQKVESLNVKIEYHRENGIDMLNKSNDMYDIIFNDANKEDYPKVFEAAKTKLKKNGLLIADNVLWYGRVASPDQDEKTAGVVSYNNSIFNSGNFFSGIIPIRDGVSVSIKL